jgi:hypothetical protein
MNVLATKETAPATNGWAAQGEPAGPGRRFTRDGSDALERRLAWICEHVGEAVAHVLPENRLEALVLGGGYGRGEGGVLKTPEGDRPYNDLEFYVCLRGHRFVNRWQFDRALHQLAGRLSPVAGVPLEFHIISLDYLRRSPVTMFYYDLLQGHRWIRGQERGFRGCEHHSDATRIPLSEGTRLLMNRVSGLLFAEQHLASRPFTPDDADFVGRNLAKAQLAFGDAVLTVFRQYHWSCLERHQRLRRLAELDTWPWRDEVCRHHAEGVEFKLHPRREKPDQTALAARHAEIRDLGLRIWLWLENRRLGRSYESARDYALCPLNKYRESNPWRNSLANLRAFGPGIFLGHGSTRSPQERLVRALALLVWGERHSDLPALRQLQTDLLTQKEAPSELARIYRELWARMN